jgi:hypothetical protein
VREWPAGLAYTRVGVAAVETTKRDGLLGDVWLVAPPFVAYAIGLTAISVAVPYRPALDDPELLSLAWHWADHGALDPAGLFRRVPLWQVLLGTGVSALGERAGVIALQAASVLAVLVALAARARAGASSRASTLVVAFLFVLSPQALLYSRHAANELFIGALAAVLIVLAGRAEPVAVRRALAAGAVVAAAAMTKLAASVLALPAVWWLARARQGRGGRLAAFAAGWAGVVVPLVILAFVQRGWPLDDTSSFNLGNLDQATWLAAGSVAERNRLALESFATAWNASPSAYLADAAARGVGWLARPGSLDLLNGIPEYPAIAVEIADHAVFFAVLVLAVLGTTRVTLVAWILPLALWVACSVPQKTPYSPRVAALIALLLLAPVGLDVLRGRR